MGNSNSGGLFEEKAVWLVGWTLDGWLAGGEGKSRLAVASLPLSLCVEQRFGPDLESVIGGLMIITPYYTLTLIPFRSFFQGAGHLLFFIFYFLILFCLS